jgi:hypothetical protein
MGRVLAGRLPQCGRPRVVRCKRGSRQAGRREGFRAFGILPSRKCCGDHREMRDRCCSRAAARWVRYCRHARRSSEPYGPDAYDQRQSRGHHVGWLWSGRILGIDTGGSVTITNETARSLARDPSHNSLQPASSPKSHVITHSLPTMFRMPSSTGGGTSESCPILRVRDAAERLERFFERWRIART